MSNIDAILLAFCKFIGNEGYHINGYDDSMLTVIIDKFLDQNQQFKSEQKQPFELYISETNQASVFVRFKDGVKEYKVEVFNNNVCVHVYENGEKKGSYFKEYKSSEQKQLSDAEKPSVLIPDDDLKYFEKLKK